ncbi:MAG TPA: hypothetical protein VEV44_15835 [Pseudoneobacillus sp.]|nr:hypothetical protein [Pseudoneobacillus sp.]
MGVLGISIFFITILAIGFLIWTVSSINEKLELIIRIQLKKDNIHFNDRDLEQEVQKYRDN